MSVTVQPLGSVCEVIAGQHIPAEQHNESGRGTPYLTGPADFGVTVPTITKWTDSPRQFARATDVLVTVKGAGVGKSNYALDAAIGRQIMALRPRPDVLARAYLFHWIRASEAKLNALGQGATVPGIGKSDLETFPIPLPPLPEQRRIADILDRADALRRKRKEGIALTDELLRSAFLDMFGDPVTNAKGWEVRPLGEVIEMLEAGWSANGDARPREDDEYGVLKVSAVTSGLFRPTEHKAVAHATIDRELVTPRAGDLLFSRANTRELVAATCLVEEDEPRLFLPDKIWRVIPKANIASAPYIRFLLAHERFRGELTKTATGTSGSMLNVSMDKLRALRAPIPPFAPQERFARTVWKILKARALHARAQDATEALFSSLVHRAFRGELSGTNGASKVQPGFLDAGGR